jgi:hypothetical protein
VSNVAALAPTFFDLYSRGEIAANRIEDFVSQWHASGDEEERSLAAFLGLTGDEYDILLMDPDTLPHILYARRSSKELTEVMADHLAALQRANRSEDRAAVRALGHWLRDRPRR